MDALPSTPPKPGAGSPLLTGGCCQPTSVTVAPDQSSMRRCRRLPCSAGIVYRRTPSCYAAVSLLAPVALAFTLARQLVSRAPAGTSPCSTYLHNAISSLRARATTPTLRARLPCCAKRRSYQRLSSLSGCQRSQPQANSTSIRRSTLLPALLIPCSRLSSPDWYGVGVRPTIAPTCRRLVNFRQPNSSYTSNHEPDRPIPASSNRPRTFSTCGVSSRRIRCLRSFSSSL